MASGGLGAGAAGADMLQEILQQKFREVLAKRQLAEQIRQADMQHQVQQQQLGQGQQRIDQAGSQFADTMNLNRDKFGFQQKAYDEAAPTRMASLRHINAQTGELEGRPAAAELARGYAEKAADRQHGFRMQEIGAQGANSVRAATIRAAGKPNATAGVQSDYGDERRTRVLQSVDELDKKISGWTVGAGSLLANIPATDARNFAAELNTLKSNIAFNELTEMRAASKTGGALGAVSDKEGKLLESALGALDQDQSPANLHSQLQKIRGSIERWEAARSGGGAAPQGKTIRARDPQGNLHEAAAGTPLPQGWKIEGQ